MDKLDKGIKKAASFLNDLAGWGIVAMMALVVINIILRKIFKNPLLGAYEYTGFVAAVIIGLSIAYCAVLDGHIAIDFIIEKATKKVRWFIGVVTGILTSVFMISFTVRLFIYAGEMAASGEVSPTTRTPFYIVVYIVSLGFTALSLVLCMKAKDALIGGDSE